MMFSIQFDNDLVLLHPRTTSLVHLLTLSIRKHHEVVFTVERVMHTMMKQAREQKMS